MLDVFPLVAMIISGNWISSIVAYEERDGRMETDDETDYSSDDGKRHDHVRFQNLSKTRSDKRFSVKKLIRKLSHGLINVKVLGMLINLMKVKKHDMVILRILWIMLMNAGKRKIILERTGNSVKLLLKRSLKSMQS